MRLFEIPPTLPAAPVLCAESGLALLTSSDGGQIAPPFEKSGGSMGGLPRCEQEAAGSILLVSPRKGTIMIRRRSVSLLVSTAALPLVALAAAACGSSGGRAGASPTPPPTTVAAAATVEVASSGSGQILVDSQGRTLYLFGKDSGTMSTCAGACATAWPPLRVTGQPTAGSGANAALTGNHPPRRWREPGHLQRPSGLPLHQGSEPRRHQRRGRDRLRGRLVRPLSGRGPDLRSEVTTADPGNDAAAIHHAAPAADHYAAAPSYRQQRHCARQWWGPRRGQQRRP